MRDTMSVLMMMMVVVIKDRERVNERDVRDRDESKVYGNRLL